MWQNLCLGVYLTEGGDMGREVRMYKHMPNKLVEH